MPVSIVILTRLSFDFCDSPLQTLRPDQHSAILFIDFFLLSPRVIRSFAQLLLMFVKRLTGPLVQKTRQGI